MVFGILIVILLAVTLGSAWAAYHQDRRYSHLATQAAGQLEKDHRWALDFQGQVAVVQDLLFLRFAGMFLSTALILVGCCFVLTGIEAALRIDGSAKGAQVALRTSSPGLVMILLGGALFLGALYRTTTFTRPVAPDSAPVDTNLQLDEVVLPPPDERARDTGHEKGNEQ